VNKLVKCPRCGFEFEPSAEEKPSEVSTETAQPTEAEGQETKEET